LLFKLLVPFWRTLAQSEAKQISRSHDNPQPIHNASAFHFATLTRDLMAIRESELLLVILSLHFGAHWP
jgi:hypothetical protein